MVSLAAAAVLTSMLGSALAADPLPARRPFRRLRHSVDPAAIDSALKSVIDSKNAVGVSALMYERGREVYFGAFGMADRENNKPMARDAIVQIFSMTKPVTGVALMQLYEQGKFELDDAARDVPPEFAERPRLRGPRRRRPAEARGAAPADHRARHHAPHRRISRRRHRRRRSRAIYRTGRPARPQQHAA